MANELKRTYNIPLRKEFMKVPRHKRSKKAVKALKQFVQRHMKIDSMDNIKVGKFLNEHIWKHGIKNPPHHVKVDIIKDIKNNKAIVELFGKEIKFADKKEEVKEGMADRVKGKLGEKFGIKDTKKPKKKEAKEEDDVLAELKGNKKTEEFTTWHIKS